MKAKPTAQDEYSNFTNALRKVLTVSHSEMKAKLDAEKQAKKRQQKRASVRVSRDRV